IHCKNTKNFNNPPHPPDKPNGPFWGQVNINYYFSTRATDPENDSVSYQFVWGNGTQSSWTKFVPSGTIDSLSQSFSSAGNYYIKARAKDKFNTCSDPRQG
ncbi:MAG: hypothetical protein ABIK19_01685, partial [candidate division WOR-3 bacterium]